jgi:hypothetical protein
MDRLDHFLSLTAGPAHDAVVLRALVLHMLRHRAPRLFGSRGLGPVLHAALEACAAVPFPLEGPPDGDALQDAVDAWYLRHVYRLPHAPPDRDAFADALRALDADDQLLYAWLLGELGAKCGLDVRVPLERPRPFVNVSRLHDGYWLTHLVLLDTDYLTRPVSHPDAPDWADALANFAPWLAKHGNLDLAGEVALCLDVLGRDPTPVLRLVQAAPPGDDPHEVATGLLALSGE